MFELLDRLIAQGISTPRGRGWRRGTGYDGTIQGQISGSKCNGEDSLLNGMMGTVVRLRMGDDTLARGPSQHGQRAARWPSFIRRERQRPMMLTGQPWADTSMLVPR